MSFVVIIIGIEMKKKKKKLNKMTRQKKVMNNINTLKVGSRAHNSQIGFGTRKERTG